MTAEEFEASWPRSIVAIHGRIFSSLSSSDDTQLYGIRNVKTCFTDAWHSTRFMCEKRVINVKMTNLIES